MTLYPLVTFYTHFIRTMLFQFFTIGRFYFSFILCVTFVTRWSCFLTVSVELYELMKYASCMMYGTYYKD